MNICVCVRARECAYWEYQEAPFTTLNYELQIWKV